MRLFVCFDKFIIFDYILNNLIEIYEILQSVPTY